ncbi:hypothetical protein PLICRDRAFT_44262 [Plicaturopsis crispa FD-325 SS-3]|nr:hypothetical protein PLICRDRAFT_44262 [Plicaturopsis crispa FD-325 SS-3]
MFRTSGAYKRIARAGWPRYHSTVPEDTTRALLRDLLRKTAQPVAVVTSSMPVDHAADSPSKFHGATLSSFTSIAMDPHPLVAFSLRMPSRMGAALKAAQPHHASHMVINILSAAQESAAVRFSRPDLHPTPFESVRYRLSEEGLPILEGSLGALSCKLVAASWPLHDLEALEQRGASAWGVGVEAEGALEAGGVASELFIARVSRVEAMDGEETEKEHLRTMPLLYHQRAYAMTTPIPPHPKQ